MTSLLQPTMQLNTCIDPSLNVFVAGIPHTVDPSSVCLSWTRKGSVKVCPKKTGDNDAPTDDSKKQVACNLAGGQLNDIDSAHQMPTQCQMGFDTMSNFAVNAGMFTAPGGTPASGMFAPGNVLTGITPELAARAITSNANWLMMPSNENLNAPPSSVALGGQESVSLDDEHKSANSGSSNACANKAMSCDACVLPSSQAGAVTIGNNGDATTVTQSLNLKTPIMATNQGSTNIAAAQQQHVINLNDPMANQNTGISVLQNPALVAGAMPGQQLRGNILMHNGQLILINDQSVMPAMVKNEGADRQNQGVGGAGVAAQSPCSGHSSLNGTPASTPVPSNGVASVASTPLFTQSMTTSNTLIHTVDGNANWTTPMLPNQLAQPAVLPPGMQPVKFVSSSTPQPPAGAAPLVANQCVTVNTPQGVVTMNTTPSQPNQLPSALVLPNGQIIPVVTQPNLLFPQQQCLPVNGGLLMAANNPPLVSHNPHMAVTTGVSGGVDVGHQMVPPQPGMVSTHPAVTGTTTSVVTPDVAPDVTPALPLGVNQQLPFHPQLAAPNIGMPLITGQQMAAVRAPSMQQMSLGVPVQTIVPGKPADQKSCVVSTATTAVATTSASPAPLTNLPSTVSAIITPEGNIILTLPPSSAGGNTGNLTFDQNGFPLLGQPAGKVVPMATAAMGGKLKKPGQRVLMPKPSQQTVTPPGSRAVNQPLGWNMANNMRSAATVATTNVTSSDNSVSEETSVTELLSVSVTTGGCVTTTTTPSATVTADLLAQATESIFSSALTDISPPISGTPSSYYNPANEDNPLHIDTSAADVAPTDDATGMDALAQPFAKPTAAAAKKPKSRPSKSSKKKSKPKDMCVTAGMVVSSSQAQTQSLDVASSHFLQQLASEKLDDDEESDINDFADLIRMPDRETGVAPPVSNSVTDTAAVTSTAARVDKKNESQLNTGNLLENIEKPLNEGSVTQALKPLHEGPVTQTQKQLHESPVRQGHPKSPVKQALKPLHESPVRQVHPKCAVPSTTQLTDKSQQDSNIFKLPEALTNPVISDTKPKSKKKSSKSTHRGTTQTSEGCTMAVQSKPVQPSGGAELMHLSMPYLSDMTDGSKTEPGVVTSVSNVSLSNTVDLTVDSSVQSHADKQPVQYSATSAVPCVASGPSANATLKVSPKKDATHESKRSRDTDHKKSKSKRSRSHQKSSKEQAACPLGDSLQPTSNNKLDVFDFDQDLMENSDSCLVLRPIGQDDGKKKSSPAGGDTSGRKRRKSSHSSKKQAQPPPPPPQPVARTVPLKPEDVIPDTIMFDDSEMELSRVLEQVESYGETLQNLKENRLSTSLSSPPVTSSLSPKKSRSRKSKTGDSADAPGTKKRKQDGTSESGSAVDSVFTQHYTQSDAGSVGDKPNVADTQQPIDNTSSDAVNTLLFGSTDMKDTMTPEDAVSSKPAKPAVTHDMLSSAISPLPWTSTVGTTSASDIQCDYSTAITTDSPTVPSDASSRMAADLTDNAFSFSSPVASLSGLSPTSDAGNVATTGVSSWAGNGEMMSPRTGVNEPMACHSHLVPLARQLAPPKLHSGALYTSQPREVGSKVTAPSGRGSKAHKSPSVNASVIDVDAKSQSVELHNPAARLGESPIKKSHGDTSSKPMESVHLTNPFSSLDDSTVPSDDDRMAKMNEFSNKQQANSECRQLPPSSASIAQVSAATSAQMGQQDQLPYSAESLLSPASEHTSWSGLKDNASPSVHSHKSPASVISQTPSKQPEQPKRPVQTHNTPVSFYSHSGFTGNQGDFSRASPKHSFALSVSCSQARQPQQEAFTFSPSFGVPASLAGNIRSSRDTHAMSPSSSSLLMTTTSPCSSSSTFSFSLSSTSNAPAMNTASYGSSLSRLQFYPPLHAPHGADQTDMSLNLHPYDTPGNEHANAMAGRHSMCSSSHDKMVSPAGIHTSFPQFSGLVDGGRSQPGNKVGRSQQYNEPQRLTHPDKEPCMNSSAALMSSSSVRMTTVSQMSARSSSVSSVSRAGAIRRSPQMIYEPGPYFGPSGFPAAGPSPLTSPPLHHPGPLLSHQRSGTVPNSSANKQRSHYDFPGSAELPFGGLPFVPPPFDPTLHLSGRPSPTNSQKDSYPLGASLNPNMINVGHKSGGAHSQGVGDTRKGSALLLPPTSRKPMPPSQPNRDAHAAVQQHQQPQKPSRSSKSSKKKQPPQQPLKQQQQQLLHQQQHHDLDPYNALFDPSRSITPYFPIGSLSPPPRNLGNNEGPTYFGAGNFFCNSQRPPSLANSKPLQHKNTGGSSVPGTADLSFNALFTPARHQNGLGINFQPPGFGMNHHAAMHSSAQIMPHANTMAMAPHMANFNLSNIFSDMNNPAPPPDSSLNISPIKFPHHSNTILPLQAGIDPSPLHHQAAAASSLYTNRSQMPPPGLHHSMSINSLLSHQHHGFDTRGIGPGINSSVAPPFGGHAHSFGIPPLNFPMHEH